MVKRVAASLHRGGAATGASGAGRAPIPSMDDCGAWYQLAAGPVGPMLWLTTRPVRIGQ
jgi:hypothetical protein